MKNVKNLSDEELVELVRSQDQELFGEVVQRYQDKLLRYATSLVGDGHQAADVVQESFIKAFINLRGFNVKRKFSSWIYRIVHNQAINQIKKKKRELSLDGNQYLKEAMRSKVDIEKDFDKQELAKMVTVCLNKLPLKYRAPLVLFYLQERSYEEISDVLRIPVGTVGTRINRGKKMLAFIWEKNGGKAYV